MPGLRAALSYLVEGLRLMQTAVEVGQENQLSCDDSGWPVESIPTVCVDERLDLVEMCLRRCEIYTNETAVADSQVGSIGDEKRFNKKLNPAEMYCCSR